MKVSPKKSVPKKSLALPLSQPPSEHEEEVVSQDCAPIAKSTGLCSNKGQEGGGLPPSGSAARLIYLSETPICGDTIMLFASLLLMESVAPQFKPPCS